MSETTEVTGNASGADAPRNGALCATGVSRSFPTRSGELVVLRSCSLALAPGESAAIMGPSGSGKSTLLNVLGTLETPSSGQLVIDAIDPFALPAQELARFRNTRIGFVFQDHHLLPQCSVLENVLLPSLANPAGPDRLERARLLLERVGLEERLDHRPSEASGGERQRAAIARALINEPAVVLADEPTGNLDRKTAESVADLLIELHRSENTILVVVTHSESLAARFEQRYELLDGALKRVT